MSYVVQPLHRQIWDDVRGEIVTLPEIFGFQAFNRKGRAVGRGGESVEEAITAALEVSGHFKVR